MRIAFVNNQVQLGGAETVVDQLRRGLTAAGHTHSLHVGEGKSYPPEVTPLYPKLLSRLDHSRFHHLVQRTFPRETWTNQAFQKLARSNADLIHVHNFHGTYATIPALAQLAHQKPLIWTFHAFWGITGGCDHPKACQRYHQQCGHCPQLGTWPIGPTDRTAKELAQKKEHLSPAPLHVIAPSRYLHDKIQSSPVGQNWTLHHIPNGVDPDRFQSNRKRDPEFRASLGLDPNTTLILLVNRNFKDPLKGFPIASQALSAPANAPIQVILAGQNSDWAAKQLPPSLHPIDAGYVTSRQSIANLYEAADIFLFASEAENFPCTILEAMSAQCTVVATPTGGVTEQISHRETGFLASEISGSSLRHVLGCALKDPQHREQCAHRARQKVIHEFSEERMIHRHFQLYKNLCSHRINPTQPSSSFPSSNSLSAPSSLSRI